MRMPAGPGPPGKPGRTAVLAARAPASPPPSPTTHRTMPPRHQLPRRPAMSQQVSEMPLCSRARPLSAAEITAMEAGRRLYKTDTIGVNATVNTILFHTSALQGQERLALDEI